MESHYEYVVQCSGKNGEIVTAARFRRDRTSSERAKFLSSLSKEEQSKFIESGAIPPVHSQILIVDLAEPDISDDELQSSIQRIPLASLSSPSGC